MTARTHDLAAFTALNLIVVYHGIPQISLSTAIASFGMCFIGGLAPDLDQSTSEFWKKIPAGSILGKIVHPLIGAHRHISHSILGIILFGLGLRYVLNIASAVVLVDMNIVWFAFMIGLLAHLIMDTLTTEGVPWFFPLSFHIGFPPFKEFRVKTGGFVEKLVIFPLLVLINAYLFLNFYPLYLALLSRILLKT